MYTRTSKEAIASVTEGFNGTIFAYGQSGSGKTYTMLGPDAVGTACQEVGLIGADR